MRDLTPEEQTRYETLQAAVGRASYTVDKTNNDATRAAYDKAIDNIMAFEKEYEKPVAKHKTSLKKLDEAMSQSYARMSRQWLASAPGPMMEQAGSIAAARMIVRNLVDNITETDAAFLLRYDDPLKVMTDQWLEEHGIQSIPKDLLHCISTLSADCLEDETRQVTVKEFLTRNPGASFDMMTPGGFVSLTPEQAKGLLAGESTSGHPGDPKAAMEVAADELLPQKIQSMRLEKGVWYLLSDHPQLEQGMTLK